MITIIIRIAVLFFIGFMIGKCYGKLNAVSEEIEVINNILDDIKQDIDKIHQEADDGK